MNFQNLIDNTCLSKLNKNSKGKFGAILSSSPLTSLFKPLDEWSLLLQSKMPGYDAAASALSSADSVFEAISNDVVDYVDSDNPVEVAQEEYESLIGGLQQAKDIIAPSAELLTITSASGLSYNLQFDVSGGISTISADNKPVRMAYVENGKCYVKRKWDSILQLAPLGAHNNSDWFSSLQLICNRLDVRVQPFQENGQPTTYLDILHSICTKVGIDYTSFSDIQDYVEAIASHYDITLSSPFTIQQGLLDLVDGLGPAIYRSVDGAQERLSSLAKGVVDLATLNAAIIACIISLRTAKIADWITNKMQMLSEWSASLKTFYKHVATAFSQGGIKGVILYLYQIIKSGSSIINDDGTLKFSDNCALMPKEYIVGLIGQVISAVVTVVGMIVSIFVPILGAIIAVLGVIGTAIFGSFKQDHNDTLASLFVPENEEQSLNALPFAPCSLIKGSVSPQQGFTWYKDLYAQSQSAAYIEVPGGALWIGPGHFNSNGEMDLIHFEFHPLGVPIKDDVARSCFEQIFLDPEGSGDCVFEAYPANQIFRSWSALMDSSYQMDMVNETSGHLSAENDAYLLGSVSFCLTVFSYWFALITGQETFAPTYDYQAYADDTVDTYKYMICGFNWLYGVHTGSWADTLKGCVALTSTQVVRMFIVEGHSALPVNINGIEIARRCIDLSAPIDIQSDAYRDIVITEANPYSIPDVPYFALSIPRLNRTTFWFWIAVVAVASAAVTVATVVLASKFAKWRKSTKAANVAKFNNAQSTYQDAINGVKTEVDPETGEIVQHAFDVNSDEGQQYINNCFKAYKATTMKCNLLANIVGGTRYDYTTFYGQREDESEPSSEDVKSAINEYDLFSLFGCDELKDQSAASSATNVTTTKSVSDDLASSKTAIIDKVSAAQSDIENTVDNTSREVKRVGLLINPSFS